MILFLGDTHGSFRHLAQIVEETRPEAIVFLGDVGATRPLETELAPIVGRCEILFIHGNHDSDTEAEYLNLVASGLSAGNLHGRVITLKSGTRIAGLGGVFRGKVWMPPAAPLSESMAAYARQTPRQDRWNGGVPLKHCSTIFYDDYLKLACERADILVTHEACSAHPNGFEAIDELARSLGAQKTFHGHHHDTLDYRCAWSRLGFDAYGVGLCGVMDDTGRIVRPVSSMTSSGSSASTRCAAPRRRSGALCPATRRRLGDSGRPRVPLP